MRDCLFDKLKTRFQQAGRRLYLVGGSARDLLLGRPYKDHDMATDATPDEMREIVPEASFAFARYGSVRLKMDGEEVDITTLREEGVYEDHRHPSYVRFIKDPAIDSMRRDFTINALYIDEEYRVLDFHGGLEDLKNGLIRFIGDPEKRIQEDPLRILRGERFAELLGFKIEESAQKAMDSQRDLLQELNKAKIDEEYRKLRMGKTL